MSNKTIWTPDNSFLLEYHAKIETGEIIAGRELWQELNNLAADFHNDEYFYNTDDAMLRMDFMEHCIKLTKSPFYGKPMQLMLWQKAFFEAVYGLYDAETGHLAIQEALLEKDNVYFVAEQGADLEWLSELYAEKGVCVDLECQDSVAGQFDVYKINVR